MGLFGHDDENKQPQDQVAPGAADDGQVPTDNGAVGGADDVQGAMPPQPQQPPVQPPVDEPVPGLPPEGGPGTGVEEGDNQVPPAAPQQ